MKSHCFVRKQGNISVCEQLGNNISAHKQLTTFVYLND